MADMQRTQEVVERDCPILWNCDDRVREFMAEDGADELVDRCNIAGCGFTEVYIRSPEPSEMGVRVIGSACVRGEIAREMDEIRQSPTLLNNFPGYLPYGFGRKAFLWGNERGTKVDITKPIERYGGKSFAELCNDINIAIAEEGIPLDEIQQLQQYKIGGDPLYNELIELMLPVYQRLRLAGYTMYGLQG